MRIQLGKFRGIELIMLDWLIMYDRAMRESIIIAYCALEISKLGIGLDNQGHPYIWPSYCKDSQKISLKLYSIVTHFVNFKHNFHKEIETFFKNELKWIQEKCFKMNPLSSELPFHVHNWLIISLKDFCIVIRKWPTFWPSRYRANMFTCFISFLTYPILCYINIY